MREISRRLGTARLLMLAALAVAVILGAILLHSATFADSGSGGQPVSSGSDMDGDGQPNPVEAYPEEGPGEVHIGGGFGGWIFSDQDAMLGEGGIEGGLDGDGFNQMSGGGGPTIQGNIILRGRTPGDRFGESVAILDDVNGNGSLDLFIGAPGAGTNGRGEAYVFYGPFEVPPGQTLIIHADDADLMLTSAYEVELDFGMQVAPLLDLTGDGRPELRVRSRYTHFDGKVYDFTQVFQGSPTPGHPAGGEYLFTIITDPEEILFWSRLTGDVLGDHAVTERDLERVLLNFGQTGENLTPFDGDLNGDGVVDGIDADIVMANMGKRVLHVDWDVNGEPLVTDGVGHWEEIEYQQPPEATLYSNGHPPGCNLPPCFDQCGCCLCCGGACDCGINCRGREFVGVAIAIDPIGFGPKTCPNPCDLECGWDDDLDVPYGPCHPECQGGKDFNPCDPDCGKDKDGNDYGPCHEECDERFCNLDCGWDHETGMPYGPCHPECTDESAIAFDACNAECGKDAKCNPYGLCHEECENPNGEVDPCDERCGEDEDGGKYGLCHPDCSKPGVDPCDERCNAKYPPPPGDPEFGPCHPGCQTRTCDSACADEHGDPYHECHEDCGDRTCNSACTDEHGEPYDECHPECAKRFCHEQCGEGFGPGHEGCNNNCNGGQGGGGPPGGGPPGGGEPPGGGPCDGDFDPCNNDCGWAGAPECAFVGDEMTVCAPSCPSQCQGNCEPDEWMWTGSGVQFPDGTTGQCVTIGFFQSGTSTLTVTNECCTISQHIQVSEQDVAWIMYRTFLHCDALQVLPPTHHSFYKGDNRYFTSAVGVTSRSSQIASITTHPDSDNGTWGAAQQVFGTTHGYPLFPPNHASACASCVGAPPGGPTLSYCDWCLNANAVAACVETATPGAGGNTLELNFQRISPTEVRVAIVLKGKNPCAGVLSPAIDSLFAIRVRQLCGHPMEYMIEQGGKHDRFPWHELYINGTPIYRYDPCVSGTGPGELATPMNLAISTGVEGQNLNVWQPVPNP